MHQMIVSVIIVNYNGLQYTRQCLESFYRYHESNSIEVIVVDNNSSDGSQKELPILFPTIKLNALDHNKGFGAANNEGSKNSTGKFIFFVNNDTLFSQNVLKELTNYLETHSDVGIVGPKLLNEDRSFQYSFGTFPSIMNEYETKKNTVDYSAQSSLDETTELPTEKDWVTGAALMIKR